VRARGCPSGWGAVASRAPLQPAVAPVDVQEQWRRRSQQQQRSGSSGGSCRGRRGRGSNRSQGSWAKPLWQRGTLGRDSPIDYGPCPRPSTGRAPERQPPGGPPGGVQPDAGGAAGARLWRRQPAPPWRRAGPRAGAAAADRCMAVAGKALGAAAFWASATASRSAQLQWQAWNRDPIPCPPHASPSLPPSLPPQQSQVMRPEVMNDRLSRFWGHKHWKVRHGLLQFMAESVCMLGEAALAARDGADSRSAVLGQIIRLVEDPERWGAGLRRCARAPALWRGLLAGHHRDCERSAEASQELRPPRCPHSPAAPCATRPSSAWRRCTRSWARP
jgi:hypothetical protein